MFLMRPRPYFRLAQHTLVAFLLWAGIFLPGAGGAVSGLERFEFAEPQMGTLFRVVLFADNPAAARAAPDAAFDRVEALNAILSDYDRQSELMRLCREPVGTAVRVSPPLWTVLSQGQKLAEATGGAFDVTAGPLVRLWRETRRSGRLPPSEPWEAGRAATGHAGLRLDGADRTAVLARPGMQLDLGGIAKGYAADEALSVLASHGFTRAMVAASGDIALGDPPPGESGWTVELVPFGRESGTGRTLRAANVGVSTSGDAEQYVEIGGVRYSHILDPRTGLGLTTPLAVTVVARRAMLSDGWATACSVLGAQESRNAIDRLPDEPLHVIAHRRGGDPQVFGRLPSGLQQTVLR